MSKLKYYDGTNWKTVNGQVTGDTLPIGAIVPFGGWDAPTGWLICDGTLLNKTDYSELFNAIGYSFGGEEGGSTFGLPDLRGRVPLGLKETDTDFDGMGLTGGEKSVSLTLNNLPTPYRSLKYTATESWGVSENNGAHYIFEDNGGQAHNNLQPYQTVNYIIKATQSAGLIANVSNTYSTSESDTYSCDYINDNFQLKPYVLFNDSSAAYTSATLYDSISNYSIIIIIGKSTDGTICSTTIYNPQVNDVIALAAPHVFSSSIYNKQAEYKFSSTTTITSVQNYQFEGFSTISQGNYIKLKTVIGWK